MLKTANNAQVVKALVAVGRAHSTIPGFELSRAMTLTTRIERVFGDERRMHVIFALVALLLKGIGAFDDGDIRRVAES
jgi:hypothetical protein